LRGPLRGGKEVGREGGERGRKGREGEGKGEWLWRGTENGLPGARAGSRRA